MADSLPPTCKTWVEFQAPCFSLVQSTPLWASEKELNQQIKAINLSLSLFLTLSLYLPPSLCLLNSLNKYECVFEVMRENENSMKDIVSVTISHVSLSPSILKHKQ